MVANRPTKSLSAEDTFEQDVSLEKTEPMIRHLAEKVWLASRNESQIARTVVIKLKTREFNILTRSHTASVPVSSGVELADVALALRGRVGSPPEQRFRLIGVALSNFEESVQPGLFE